METTRSIDDIDDRDLAKRFAAQLAIDLQDDSCPPEDQSLGRPLHRWHDKITAWHRTRVTNGLTEATNNLIERIK
ncbi:MAG: transposase [Actinomycetia bacterium]|nr:transposase [Actinomycetes bacterium]